VLIDFGATREYQDGFIDDYIELVWAASNSDRSAILDYSIKLGFLTGEESRDMVNAHIEAGLEVGRPFQRNAPFDFRASKIAQQMSKHGDTFLNERLTPPPMEIYSLHRRLSGAYMTCIKMGAVFPCRDLLEQAYRAYHAEKKLRRSVSV
jgi:aarF domain-containing kinase